MLFWILSFSFKGKYYYEVSCHDQGLCRVGWSTMQASLDLGECLSEEKSRRQFSYLHEMFESCSSLAEKASSTGDFKTLSRCCCCERKFAAAMLLDILIYHFFLFI